MLCVNHYSKEYIAACRAKVDQQLRTYRKLFSSKENLQSHKDKQANAVEESFEVVFFNNMVMTLECYFFHRSRTLEKKDGNPLNEVRMLVNSMMLNEGRMAPDNTIKYVPDKAILKLQLDDEIKLKEKDFLLISKAFFTELESKFLQKGSGESIRNSMFTRLHKI
jgi:hypothetical protein